MATATESIPAIRGGPPDRRYTPEEFAGLYDAGILDPDGRWELLDGLIVRKPVSNPPHDSTLQRLGKRLHRLPLDGWEVRIQLSASLGGSVPLPDAAMARGDDRTYDHRHPGGVDLGVVMEVADSSLTSDRRTKGRLYAESGVPVYWIINIVDGVVEVYSDPDPATGGYRARTDYGPGDAVTLTLDGAAVAQISVGDIIP